MKNFSRALIIIIFAGPALFSLKGVFAANTPAEGYKVPKGQTVEVTGPVSGTQTCKKVTNNCSADIFVPTKSAAEWTGNFIPNKPACVSLAECVNCDEDNDNFKNSKASCDSCDLLDQDYDYKQIRALSRVFLTGSDSNNYNAAATFSRVVKASDGGFFVMGHSAYRDIGDSYFAKFDCSGNKQWSKIATNSGGNSLVIHDIQRIADGYIGAGSITYGTYPEDSQGLIIKINTNGTIAWAKSYNPESDGDEFFYRIIQLSTGDFAAAGRARNDLYTKGYIVKVNSSGTKSWSKIIRANNSAVELFGVADAGGGAVIASGFYDRNAYLVKFNSNGSKSWSRAIGGGGSDGFTSLIKTSDNNFLAAGQLYHGNYDAWIYKFNTNGGKIWSTIIDDGSDYGYQSETFYDVIMTSDNGFLAGGNASHIVGWLVKFNSSGNKQWIEYLPPKFGSDDSALGSSYAQGLAQLGTGEYLAVGEMESCTRYCYDPDGPYTGGAAVFRLGANVTVDPYADWNQTHPSETSTSVSEYQLSTPTTDAAVTRTSHVNLVQPINDDFTPSVCGAAPGC